jgi:catechol 2,3-dioxygenase-like lactoylglutathione lyase family enzyme
MHVGVLSGDLERSMQFYGGILGFREFWRGSSTPEVLSWVNIKPAEGDSYLELMLYSKLPAPGARGTAHHVCLAVPDAEKALAELKARAARGLYTPAARRPMEIHIGKNRKRQINLYDPDGTRVEVMEANTIDGRPAPSSTAPPPHPMR